MRNISDNPVKMRFIDAPIGCLFKYDLDSDYIWIKINHYGHGFVAEYDPQRTKEPNWVGQIICSFTDDLYKGLEREIFVVG